jgi:hypothetical protein
MKKPNGVSANLKKTPMTTNNINAALARTLPAITGKLLPVSQTNHSHNEM